MRTSTRDILQAASLFIEQYGDGAEMYATMKADEQLATGDRVGEDLWKRILRAITLLQTPRDPSRPLH